MEFQIDKKDFIKGLEKTLALAERRSTMPSLSHALLEVKNESVQISATDLEIFITSTSPCRTLTEGRMAVPAKNFYDIVSAAGDAEIIHVKAVEGNRVDVFFGKSKFKLLGLAADSFPHFKASPKGQLTSAKFNCKKFANFLAKTEYAVSTEEVRYFLTGVYIENINPETLRAVATDSHRLALQEIVLEKGAKDFSLTKGLILPKKGSAELRKLLETSEAENFEMTCDENLIRASVGDYKLWIRPIDGEYPNYKPSIPENLQHKVVFNKKDFVRGLKKMALLVSDRSRVVVFDFQNDKVILSTNNPDVGEATDEVNYISGKAEVKTGFNVRFFIEAVNSLDGEEIHMELGEKLQPCILRSPDEKNGYIIIMPMRI